MLIYFIVFLGYFSFLSRNRFFVFSSEFERDDGLLYCILQLLFIFIFPEKKKDLCNGEHLLLCSRCDN